MSPFLRKVKTASGATAVQIAVKEGRRDKVIEHLGSAHMEAELAALMEIGRHRIAPDQLALDLTTTPPAVSGLLTASAPVGTDAVGVQALGPAVGRSARGLHPSGAEERHWGWIGPLSRWFWRV